ncbi:MAG: hypothetical protein K2H15_00335 [Muribaculaceae bacterium]|nr:hypothetical protein [Muribaculaceae bacterium]
MERYCIYADIEALRKEPEGPDAELHRRRIAANVGDPVVVRRLFNLDPEEFVRFYPDMGTFTPSTGDTISTFLTTYGRVESGELRVEREELSVDEMIRRGEYESALQRIVENNLKNSEKSIYFADQTRFLRKLIAIQGKKQK